MHYGHHKNFVGDNFEKNCKWKSLKQYSSNIAVYDRVRVRIRTNGVYCSKHLIQKLMPQTGPLKFIP